MAGLSWSWVTNRLVLLLPPKSALAPQLCLPFPRAENASFEFAPTALADRGGEGMGVGGGSRQSR